MFMGYVRLIPSMAEYAEAFRKLDPLDFEIIKAMYRFGVSNVSRLAKAIGVPQQTVSYRVKRFDDQSLVLFRALINEARLGLKSYVVVASVQFGKENISSMALTCFPLWRYLAIVDGWKHACYVRYAIPPDKERDLEAFLNELKRRGLISEFEIFPTTSPNYPLLNLDFYKEGRGIPVFNWDKWVKDYNSFQEAEFKEPVGYEKARFDLYDLIILRCLEINARMTQRSIVKEMARIIGEKEHGRLIPLVSRRLRESIMAQGLIVGYRAYLFPNPEPTAQFITYHLTFPNSSSLRKFITGLSHLPYNTGYEKVLGRNELFVRLILPVYEFSALRKSLMELAERGYLSDARLLIGDLAHATWDNVEIYQMYKDGAWNFSYGVAIEMLENVMSRR
jgi:DNA-binding Lrp family transcriptional regulator